MNSHSPLATPCPLTFHRRQDVGFFTLPALDEQTWLVHGCTTRWGGVSRRDFASLNLGCKTQDDAAHVRENYRLLATALGVDPACWVLTDQTHTTRIRTVEPGDGGVGLLRPHLQHDVDGLISDVPGLTLAVVHADCQPLLLADPVRRAVGAVHAGWRGSAGNIAAAAVKALQERYGSRPQDVIGLLGPAIGPCCYQVDRPVMEQFLPWHTAAAPLWQEQEEGKYLLHLAAVNRAQLLEAGLNPQNIHLSGLCTQCHNDLFFSHRQQQGRRGLCASVIGVR